MSISFPLSLALFQDAIRFKQITFSLPSNNQQTSGQGSGLIIAKDLAPSLWSINAQTVPLRVGTDADTAQAMLELLDGSINTFLAYSPLRTKPKAGTVDDTNVKINSVGTDGVSLSLKGLPAGFVINVGDMLGYQYGSNSSYGLHKAMEQATANGSGVTPEFRVAYGPYTGTTSDLPVKLNKPTGEFRLMGAFAPSNDDAMHMSYSFNAIQVLR